MVGTLLGANMRTHHSLAEILNISSSERACASTAPKRQSQSQPVETARRDTEEYECEELESVLKAPAGPLRMPEAQVGTTEGHIHLLQNAIALHGRSHERVAARMSKTFQLLPLACGGGVGVTVALFVVSVLL